jgi:hypothetical protein
MTDEKHGGGTASTAGAGLGATLAAGLHGF